MAKLYQLMVGKRLTLPNHLIASVVRLAKLQRVQIGLVRRRAQRISRGPLEGSIRPSPVADKG